MRPIVSGIGVAYLLRHFNIIMKQFFPTTSSKEVVKVAICPLAYLFTFIVGEVGMALLSGNHKNYFGEILSVVASKDLIVTSFLMFIFLSVISLVSFKLLKIFHYFESNRFLLNWGILMGIVSVVILSDLHIGSIVKFAHFLF